MAVRPILCYGDARLEAANKPVTDFGPGLAALIQDLFETGWKAPGLGVAAPQIGVNLRLATIDLSVGSDEAARIVLANPEIVSTEGTVSLEEGCLSFPDLFTTIERPRRLRVRAQDEHGAWRTIAADGLLAQAICHEVDHLDGVLLVDHLRGLKRQVFLRRVARARKLGVWPGTA
ncbi:MAG TPA: peptide deformylase [Thermoanaerobaculales bacterium]|nr:peptide deformylase [Thermoanaerobaculales bacterium]HQL29784.1 peptide deformylase [Thermoanaerobaculales bacterium]HQN97104.1 peptide deformylase [Thermoanaerobaculales bacterium]HQP43375.1 peptide deformylase [Thermoanaerobaculales bacterium]